MGDMLLPIPVDSMPAEIQASFAKCVDATASAYGLAAALHAIRTGTSASVTFAVVGTDLVITAEQAGKVVQ